jgi:hypothetical protein
LKKPILWALIAGLATGLSLPFVLPTPTPSLAPVVASKKKSSHPRLTKTLVAESENSTARLISQPVAHPVATPRHHRGRRNLKVLSSRGGLDRNTMERLQAEDSRAWAAANRMLARERRV